MADRILVARIPIELYEMLRQEAIQDGIYIGDLVRIILKERYGVPIC
jgi:hypothetical protein